MAGKQLPIVIKGSDQASPVVRRVTGNVQNLGRIGVRVTQRLVGGIGNLLRRLTSLKALIVGVAAAVAVRRIIGSLVTTSREIDRIAKTSLRLDVPIEKLSELSFVADRQGIEFEGLAAAYRTANKNLGELAATGSGEARDAVRKLGIELYTSEGRLRDVVDLLPDISDGLRGLAPGEQGYIVSKLFGRQGTELLSLLKLSREEIIALRVDAERFGAVITASQARAAQRVVDSLTNISTAWRHVKASVIEEIEPSITPVINAVAASLASLPRMIGNVAFVVRQTLFGGEHSGELKEQLTGVIDALGVVAIEGVRNVGRLVFVAAVAVTDALFQTLGPRVAAGVTTTLFDGVIAGQREAVRLIREHLGDTWIGEALGLEGIAAGIDAVLLSSKGVISKGIADAFGVGDPLDMFDTFTGELTWFVGDIREAMDQMRADVGPAADLVNERLASMIATIEKLRGLTSGGLLGNDQDTDAQVSKWTNLFNGIKQGIKDVRDSASDLYSFARSATASVINSLSSGLAGAFIDAISGAESFGKAMKQVLSNVLRMVAELILQFLILRAISGIAGSVFGAGNGTVVPDSFSAPGTSFARDGGLVTNKGVVRAASVADLSAIPRYGAGGMIGGARMYRDNQVILGMPGEHMMSRRGVAATGVRTLQRGNLGERLVPASEGGGFSINLTVNIQAGERSSPANMERATRKGVTEALIESIGRNPGARRRLREALG